MQDNLLLLFQVDCSMPVWIAILLLLLLSLINDLIAHPLKIQPFLGLVPVLWRIVHFCTFMLVGLLSWDWMMWVSCWAVARNRQSWRLLHIHRDWWRLGAFSIFVLIQSVFESDHARLTQLLLLQLQASLSALLIIFEFRSHLRRRIGHGQLLILFEWSLLGWGSLYWLCQWHLDQLLNIFRHIALVFFFIVAYNWVSTEREAMSLRAEIAPISQLHLVVVEARTWRV